MNMMENNSTNQPQKRIAVAIIAYNSENKLVDCFESLKHQSYPWELIDLILVDNNSKDNSVALAEKSFASVRIIKNTENKGFATANNQAYELAKSLGDEYLALLNDDTIVDPDWLSKLVVTAESDAKIAAVQAKLMLWPEKDLINSYGNSLTFLGFGFCNNYRETDKSDVKLFEVPYASGGAMVVKLSILEKTGLFDDDFFMYHEDVDLGWKLRLAGYRIMLDPTAVVYHKYSFFKDSYKYLYLERNRILVYLRNYQLATLFVLAPMFMVMELGIIFFAWRSGWLKEKLSGYGWLIANWRKIIVGRKKIQNLRQIKDKEILSLLTASVKIPDFNSKLLNRFANPLMEAYFWLVKKIIFW